LRSVRSLSLSVFFLLPLSVSLALYLHLPPSLAVPLSPSTPFLLRAPP
jgi:hypothetical protein